MAACVVALLTVLQLVSCDYKPQPKTFSDYVVRGEFLTRAGRFDEAIENYHKALEIDPESAVVYFRLGQALSSKASWIRPTKIMPKHCRVIQNYLMSISNGAERSNPKVSWMKPSKNIKKSLRRLRNSIWHTSFGPTRSKNKAD